MLCFEEMQACPHAIVGRARQLLRINCVLKIRLFSPVSHSSVSGHRLWISRPLFFSYPSSCTRTVFEDGHNSSKTVPVHRTIRRYLSYVLVYYILDSQPAPYLCLLFPAMCACLGGIPSTRAEYAFVPLIIHLGCGSTGAFGKQGRKRGHLGR